MTTEPADDYTPTLETIGAVTGAVAAGFVIYRVVRWWRR